MKKQLNVLLKTALLIGVLCSFPFGTKAYADNVNVEGEGVADSEAISVYAEYGAEVDGYELNHNHVQVLNINTGNITIGDESFTQQNGETNSPWDTRTDAYVIRGKGNSKNNIVITATKKTTIYLMDLEWAGSIILNKSNNINFVVCGSVVNKNGFLVAANTAGTQINNLTFSSLTDTAVLYVNTLIDRYSISELLIEDCKITANNAIFNSCTVKKSSYIRTEIYAGKMDQYGTIAQSVYVNNNIPDTTVHIESSTIKFSSVKDVGWSTNNLIVTDSTLENMVLFRQGTNGKLDISNSTVTELRVYSYNSPINNVFRINDSTLNKLSSYIVTPRYNNLGQFTNYTVTNSTVFKIIANKSILRIGQSPIISMEADKCTIETLANTAITNFVADSCSIKGDFIGTPVDFMSNDLSVKIIRLREHPNEEVMVSFNGGEEVKLLTDLNGCLYPYVNNSCKSITITTQDGIKNEVTITPGSDDDGPVEVEPGENNGNGPTIEDGYPLEYNKTVGDTKSIGVTATPKNPDSILEYQWYKDGVILPDETFESIEGRFTLSDVGTYYCVVTEPGVGSTTSKTITVTVTPKPNPNAPIITAQTSNMNLMAGSDITLQVDAKAKNGRNELSYQWYQDNTLIEGATANTLVLTNIKKASAGNYKCIITDVTTNISLHATISKIKVK